jgi:hydrogenase 3 maturation protease
MSGTIVLGIGNRLGGDDAAGTHVVDILNRRKKRAKGNSTSQIIAVDVGTAPESYTSVIRQHRPDLLIMVDAADMGLQPGALRIIPPEKITVLSFSTHHMPLSMLVSYVNELCGEVLLVGLQPEATEMSKCLSRAVRKSVKELAEFILEGHVAEIPLLT